MDTFYSLRHPFIGGNLKRTEEESSKLEKLAVCFLKSEPIVQF